MIDLPEKDINKLEVMYEGDKNRDASNKIRGFLFQDYVTIMCLLKDNVKCVCSEYIEDIDVFYEDKRFEIIQVKYYPKTSPDMKEILTDLYYQFLRLQILGSSLKAVPSLYIHRDKQNNKPTLEEMKNYIGFENGNPNTNDGIETDEWLKNNVHMEKKKEEQKKNLFDKKATEGSIEKFIAGFNIYNECDINTYKDNLMKKLAEKFGLSDNVEKWKLILLGLAIVQIQKRYNSDKQNFKELRINKKEFIDYIKDSVKTKTDQTIASYLVGIACEKYEDIINNNTNIDNNNLSELQLNMINLIYKNTINWINKLGNNVDGQYQLFNTFSLDEANNVSCYKELQVHKRLDKMKENKRGFMDFLSYLWKIMLNICQDKTENENQIPNDENLFDPCFYIEKSVKEYVCFNFPGDKSVNRSMILPKVGSEFISGKRKLVSRIVQMPNDKRPGKWFLENSKIEHGKNYYDYSTANVIENSTVVDLGEDSFYIKCMECIGIDEGEWGKYEICGECIFSEECVKAKEGEGL